MKVAILGSGPSGMMASHAASEYGAKISIFDSSPDKSRRNSGVYFLHDDCNLLLDSIKIRQTILGINSLSEEQISEAYGLKVYGKLVSKVSILNAIKNKEVSGYNAGQAIERLWDLYKDHINRQTISGLKDVEVLLDKYDKVISTIPARVLYPNYKYEHTVAWIKVGTSPKHEAFILYSVSPNHNWYRCSAMFGVFVMEYGYDYVPPAPSNNLTLDVYEYKKVIKVLGEGLMSTISDLFLVGRYGAWKKATLTHDVFYEVLKWLEKN